MKPINNITTVINKLTSKPNRFRESRFALLEKTQDLDIASLTNSSEHIPENASTYSLVSIGKKEDESFIRNIITFKDKNNQVIRKILSGTNEPARIRDYDKQVYAKDGWNEFLEVRHIKTKSVNPETNKWEKEKEEYQYIHTNTNKYKHKKGFARKLHIEKNTYQNTENGNKVTATITEYPYNLGFENKSAKKVMGVEMSVKNNRPHIDKITPDTNMDLPKNDEFLPYRFLLGEQKQTSLTQNVLDRKGIGNLGINIYYSKEIVPGNSEGLFNHLDGNIYYKQLSKAHPVIIAGHEGEHAYQYSLIARLGKLLSRFGVICRTNLPQITDIKELDKGYKYVIAAEKYPKLSPTENLKNNKEYWDNELEAGARLESEKLKNIYDKGRQVFLELFPFSKSNTNF